MKKVQRVFLFVLVVILLFSFGCSGDDEGLSDSENTVNGGSDSENTVKSAEPFPVQTIDTTYNTIEEKTFTNEQDFESFIFQTWGEDSNNYPEEIIYLNIYWLINQSSYPTLKVKIQGYQLVENMVFFEYCNWYQPNSSLSITLSNINESSVSQAITTSVGASIGYEGFSIKASISKETTKTVSTANGIEVSTSYELTQYDQSKLYKAVLVGSYACQKYIFEVGDESWVDNFISVDQSSLAVKLVHN